MARRLQAPCVILLTAALMATACSEPRPSIEAWDQSWRNVTSLIPAESTLGDPPSEEACENVLVSLRASEDSLFPAPSQSLEETVRSWLEVAEGAFFDCPPAGDDFDGFSSAYEALSQLEAEVEGALSESG